MADATLTYHTRFSSSPDAAPPQGLLALVLIWSQDEPSRVGELLPIAPSSSKEGVVYGRESKGQTLEKDRVRLSLQRPGRMEPMALSQSPRISRNQLKIRHRKDGNLEVENLGRLPLFHNGTAVDAALVGPGDILELKEQQLFLCVERMSEMPPIDPPPSPDHSFGDADAHGIVGESPGAWALRRALNFAAKASAHILIQGPSGSGKELVAKGLHNLSSRGHKPLVSRNAATFPEGLIDAELFGNAKGFPNPGMIERVGLIGQADGSSLFLDEFGELPSEMQAHLLRVMDEGEYQRLGESQARRSDFRLIAATNRPADQLKHDVAARLKLRITLPSLNERREDIPLIARHLLTGIAARDPAIIAPFLGTTGSSIPRLSPALMASLVRHHYTTHVRELEAFLWQALSGSHGGYLDLTPEMSFAFTPPGEEGGAKGPVDPMSVTKEQLMESLTRHKGVQARVWKELGLTNRFVLRRLLKKYDINPEEFDTI